MSNLLKPLEAPFPKESEEVLKNYPRINGYLLKLFRMFANSPRFLEKAVPNLLDEGSPLSLRQRELVIQRVTALHVCEYEWGVHIAVFAATATITAQEITWLLHEEVHQSEWSEKDFLLLNFTTQLIRQGGPDETTSTALRNHFSREQQLEICALCGTYSTISFAANSAQLDREEFAPSFSDYRA